MDNCCSGLAFPWEYQGPSHFLPLFSGLLSMSIFHLYFCYFTFPRWSPQLWAPCSHSKQEGRKGLSWPFESLLAGSQRFSQRPSLARTESHGFSRCRGWEREVLAQVVREKIWNGYWATSEYYLLLMLSLMVLLPFTALTVLMGCYCFRMKCEG